MGGGRWEVREVRLEASLTGRVYPQMKQMERMGRLEVGGWLEARHRDGLWAGDRCVKNGIRLCG